MIKIATTRSCMILLIVCLGSAFYLSRLAIIPTFVGWYLPGFVFIFIQVIWFVIGLLIIRMVLNKRRFAIWDKYACTFLLLTSISLLEYNDLPDKLDFILAKKKLLTTYKAMQQTGGQWLKVAATYSTEYPDQIPFIADSRFYAFATPSEVNNYINEWKGYRFLPISNDGWYVLYEENVYDRNYYGMQIR